jgi:hypothetical protein
MGLHDKKPCPCGSGKMSWWLSDARGIPVSRVCEDCEKKIMAQYRPEIFTNPEYEDVDFRFPVEPDEEYRKKKTAKLKKRKTKKCKCKK